MAAAVTIGEFLAREVPHLAVLVVLLAAGAFFSGAETALFSLSRGELFNLARDDRRLSRLAASIMGQPDNVLTTVLLGTNVIHIIYFVFSTLLVVRAQRAVAGGDFWASALALGSLLAMIIFSEILPKTVAFLMPVRLAPSAAAVLAPLGRLVRPVHRFLMAGVVNPLTRLLAPSRDADGQLTSEEMAALLALSQKRGLIGQDEAELLQEVLELTRLRAGDIMVPRVDVVAYEADGPPGGLVDLMRTTGVTKVPVFEGDLDHVIGVVYAKRLLAEPGKTVRELLAPVQFVPESAPLERVLIHFRSTRSQLAIVVDEYGGMAGLVTLEDILEEVVGDIADAREPRRAPPVQRVGPAEWLVDGDLAIHEWADAFPTDLRGARFSTVGGFVVSLLGQIPQVGQTARYRNVTFIVEAVRGRRIATLRVRLEEGEP
ncbi:MAG: hypothetical protein B1H04_00105 [Planctomycetales bacterium 4484_123]|nr:MAG: hypothetical protein B1H04_00105 [Planctomycetales bacterium 4484_123]